MTRATIVVPTHDHADTLYRSVASALAQTVRELEIFIVGDGVPDATRPIVAELTRRDGRVRFFDHPKGSGFGERHRHLALQHARGRIVCYLSDDDLWLPEHVEVLERQLHQVDLAHTMMVSILAEGALEAAVVDVGRPGYLDMLRRNHGGFGLACAGHTLDAYRRLPEGWRPRSPGLNSDAQMWVQFLEQPWCRAASVMRPTVLHFASGPRRTWPVARRLDELDRWSAELGRPGGLEDFRQEVLEALAWNRIHHLDAVRDRLDAELAELARVRAVCETLQRQLDGRR